MPAVDKIIALASKHVGADPSLTSARVCRDRAIDLLLQNNVEAATAQALKSLMHSVGIFHTDYYKAKALIESNTLDE